MFFYKQSTIEKGDEQWASILNLFNKIPNILGLKNCTQ